MASTPRDRVPVPARIAKRIDRLAAARGTRPSVVLESAILRAVGVPGIEFCNLEVIATPITELATLLTVFYCGRFAGLVFDVDSPQGGDSAATSWEPHFEALLRAQGATCAI